MNTPMTPAVPVSEIGVDARATFIGRTYSHLFGSIVAFTAIEIFLFQQGWAEKIYYAAGANWLIFLGAFMVGSWLATRVAHQATTLPSQYLALGGFIALWSVIFAPLLFVAHMVQPDAITHAALITLLAFSALTVIVFMTRKDFSFLGPFLWFGGICALILIVVSAIAGFSLGPIFCVGMILLCGGSILYDTSNILHHYPEDRYVGAALELFGSVALLFWYVLQLVLSMSND